MKYVNIYKGLNGLLHLVIEFFFPFGMIIIGEKEKRRDCVKQSLCLLGLCVVLDGLLLRWWGQGGLSLSVCVSRVPVTLTDWPVHITLNKRIIHHELVLRHRKPPLSGWCTVCVLSLLGSPPPTQPNHCITIILPVLTRVCAHVCMC